MRFLLFPLAFPIPTSPFIPIAIIASRRCWEDRHFPQFRSFDWFDLHSWSRGVIPSADGKDQESTSEELNLLQPGTARRWGGGRGDGKRRKHQEKAGKILGLIPTGRRDAWIFVGITLFRLSRYGHSSGFQR